MNLKSNFRHAVCALLILGAAAVGMRSNRCEAGLIVGGGDFGVLGEINIASAGTGVFGILNFSYGDWLLTELSIQLPTGITFLSPSAGAVGDHTFSHEFVEIDEESVFGPDDPWSSIHNGTGTAAIVASTAAPTNGSSSFSTTFTGFDPLQKAGAVYLTPADDASLPGIVANYDAWGFNTDIADVNAVTTTGKNPNPTGKTSDGSVLDGTLITVTFFNSVTEETIEIEVEKTGKGGSVPFWGSGSASNPIPEPMSLAIWGGALGMATIVGAVRRRKRA